MAMQKIKRMLELEKEQNLSEEETKVPNPVLIVKNSPIRGESGGAKNTGIYTQVCHSEGSTVSDSYSTRTSSIDSAIECPEMKYFYACKG